jgi:beta-galactosidase
MYASVARIKQYGEESHQKPLFLCEYALGNGNSMGNLMEYWEAIEKYKSLIGGCIWDWADQGILEKDVNGRYYYAYAGDYGPLEIPPDANFVFCGLIFSDRTPSPKLWELKKVYQYISIQPMAVSEGRIKIQNKYPFTNLAQFDAFWSVEEDGEEIQQDQLEALNIEPGESRIVTVPIQKIRHVPGAEYWLKLSFRLKEKTVWAEEGHEVAWEQFQLPVVIDKPILELSKLSGLSYENRDNQLIVNGKDFSISFHKISGVMNSFIYKGKEFLDSDESIPGGPVLNVYRAPTKNDQGLAVQWRNAGLDRLERKVISFDIEYLNGGLFRVNIKTIYKGKNDCGFEHHCTYNIIGNGQVLVDNQVKPFGPLPTLARMGVMLTLPGEFNNLTYYGRGPHENYCDRKSGAALDLYQSSIADQYVPYGIPQENGAKQDIRWLALTNQDGIGLSFVKGSESFAMTALPYTIDDLEKATHLNELSPRNFVTLCIDAHERGVGNSVDAVERETDGFIIKQCAVDPEIYAFSYSIRPYEPGTGTLHALTRTHIPVVLEPVIKRNPQGFIYISGATEEGNIYYSTDGSESTNDSHPYNGPFLNVGDCTIKAVVHHKTLGKSRVNTSHFDQLIVEEPLISPRNVYFFKSLGIAVKSETEDASIYYTLDGSEPDVNSKLYTEPISIDQDSQLKFRAFKSGYKPSDINGSEYKKFIPASGVHYKYFTTDWESIPHSIKLIPERTGTVDQLSYRDIETNKSTYALQFLALLKIEKEGMYTFYTGSNDGSMLYINSTLVVSNGGDHGYTEESGKIFLPRGEHFIEVGYNQVGGGQDLFVFYEGPGIEKQEIPASAFK